MREDTLLVLEMTSLATVASDAYAVMGIIGLTFGVGACAMLVIRRRVFPVNGRVLSLVLIFCVRFWT